MLKYNKKNNCEGCPFKSRTCGTRGPLDADVVIVGESPGLNEIVTGQPFVGASGELLSILLKEVGIDEQACFITYALSCLPPRSKDKMGKPVKDGVINNACRVCRGRLVEEISAYPRKLIIGMGSAASRSLTQRWGMAITKARGQVEKSNLSTGGILPTFHPAYILRNPSATPQLRSDLQKAAKIIRGDRFPNPKISYMVLETKEDIDYIIKNSTVGRNLPVRFIADIETTGLSRQNDGFICIGFIFDHQLSKYGNNTVYVVKGVSGGALVKYLFDRMPGYVEWVWHNGKFDTSFLRAKGIKRSVCRVDHDTLLLSYTLDETGQRHSLEQCIMDHLGLPAYKDMLGAWIGTGKSKRKYADVPRPLLYSYMSKDVVYTGLLFKVLWPRVVKSTELHKVYTNLLIPASNTLATIELNGMPIDQEVLETSILEIQAKIEPLLLSMQKIVL
jgi:DNA polymerase